MNYSRSAEYRKGHRYMYNVCMYISASRWAVQCVHASVCMHAIVYTCKC